MDELRKPEFEGEPVGIVISRGSRSEEPPRFSAYVWGPVPETEPDTPEKMVAA